MARVRSFRHYQRRSDPIRVVADRAAPDIVDALRKALRTMRDAVPRNRLMQAIVAADADSAALLMDAGAVRAAMNVAIPPLRSAFLAGAELGLHDIGIALAAAVRKDTAGGFGGDDPYAFALATDELVAEIRAYEDALIAELGEDSRTTVFDAVVRGFADGETPEVIAQRIRDTIGLTERQARAVENFRTMLESGDAEGVLARALRDPVYDVEVRSIIAGARPSPETIDAMVSAYADRYLDYRAATIARTEATRAANLGLHAAYRQAVVRGVFPQASVKRYWQVALDEKVCPICEAIPDANETGVEVGEPFATPGGPTDDPPMHVNCRCSVQYRTDLDMVRQARAGLQDIAA